MVNGLCIFFMLDASRAMIKSVKRCKKRMKLLKLMCLMSCFMNKINTNKNQKEVSPSCDDGFQTQRQLEVRQSITEINDSQLL